MSKHDLQSFLSKVYLSIKSLEVKVSTLFHILIARVLMSQVNVDKVEYKTVLYRS